MSKQASKPGSGRDRAAPRAGGGRRWLVPGVSLAVVALAGLVAFGASALGRGAGQDAASPQRAPVTVTGAPLAPMSDAAADPAVGQAAPVLQGTDLQGAAMTVPGPGRPKLVLFLAHWCPHCQKEVPMLSEWLVGGNTPAAVDLYAVATSTDSSRPNYPPAAWLEREGWPVATMADSGENTAGNAYGVTGYPTFVAVDAGGTVVARRSGELSLADVQGLIDLAAGASG